MNAWVAYLNWLVGLILINWRLSSLTSHNFSRILSPEFLKTKVMAKVKSTLLKNENTSLSRWIKYKLLLLYMSVLDYYQIISAAHYAFVKVYPSIHKYCWWGIIEMSWWHFLQKAVNVKTFHSLIIQRN